jgi:hypothetical protein
MADMQLAALLASAACLAGPVQPGLGGTVVRAGPFLGSIVPYYDVVDGRFSLHVGPTRDRDTGLSQKIPWWVSRRSPVKGLVVITGRRLDAPGPSWREVLTEAQTGAVDNTAPGLRVYPSILTPPAAGCWRLTFSSGRVRAKLLVLVRDIV